MWWIVTAALAAPPTATLRWGRGGATATFGAPEGQKIAPDAPATVEARAGDRSVRWTGTGAQLSVGIPIDARGGDAVVVSAALAVCTDATGTCTPVQQRWSGTLPAAGRGSFALHPEQEQAEADPFRADAAPIVDAAFATAAARGVPVLLDFAAVWCPPCNQLAAEVLHPGAPALDAVVVATVDVDDPTSWPVKNRYRVGGYPTVVLARADGAELGRIVGYPGRDAFLAWVSQTAARAEPTVDPNDRDPATTPPDAAADIAWSLVQQGRVSDAERWIDAAAAAVGSPALYAARFHARRAAADADWLAVHPGPPGTPGWVGDWAGPATTADDAVRAIARAAIDAALPTAEGLRAPELLTLRAALVPPAESAAWNAAAAAALGAALTGEPDLDRAHITWLADLRAQAGALDAAVATLDAWSARYPDEPTFDLAAAGMLNEAGRYPDARDRAVRALDHAWGDNLLRVAAQLCRAQVGLGDAAAAAATARAALDAVPAPDPALQVRSPRYRRALEAYLSPP